MFFQFGFFFIKFNNFKENLSEILNRKYVFLLSYYGQLCCSRNKIKNTKRNNKVVHFLSSFLRTKNRYDLYVL